MNNLWQFRARNVFSITIICLSFLIVGIFVSLSNNLRYMAQQISKDMVVVFFLEKNMDASDRAVIEQELNNSSLVSRIQFISSEQALQNFLNKFPELEGIIENLETNPFPSSLEVTLKEKDFSYEETQPFLDKMKQISGIEDVQFNKDWVEKMQSLSRLARAVGFFLGGILILASFFIVSNVIKLNVFARKDEIEILRLVGGTNTFIRIPFLAEGIILGALGGMLSLLLLFIVIRLFPVYLGSSLGVLNELISFRYLSFSQSTAIISSGAIIGFFGSMSSLAKFLKT
ncbi:MAG: permease-like cell division protein FtsX [Candidatus Aminicenantes bacterium]|nr:permease-like cell division protein FtsX [Candidatus Aminicenantes bacterium]MDH5384142.1 permease-like cell division protein FtsX [Candidatus Aminicenantes bacterium]MDH5742984.1 permease-like cell division protein FtsX [Candidatus Aminicenantes bacterium]